MTFPTILLRTSKLLQQVSEAIVGHLVDANKDIVLITGGSNGLGAKLVDLFSSHGFTVINLDKFIASDNSLQTPNRTKFAGRVHNFQCDVSDLSQIEAIKPKIDDIGPVTVLINNAGVMINKPVTELDFSEIEFILKVNLISNFYTVKTFLPKMLEIQRGYIVTVASVLGYMSPANLSAYGASKSGVIALHESLTYELGPPSSNPKGIKTLLVAPGQIKTSMFSKIQTPSPLLAPNLEASYVANIIFEALELGKRGEIKVPLYGKLLPLFRAFPWRVVEILRQYSGMDDSVRRSRLSEIGEEGKKNKEGITTQERMTQE